MALTGREISKLNRIIKLAEQLVESGHARSGRKYMPYGKDIHIWEHYDHQSYGFLLGVSAGGQEATNKYHNMSIWKSAGLDTICFTKFCTLQEAQWIVPECMCEQPSIIMECV